MDFNEFSRLLLESLSYNEFNQSQLDIIRHDNGPLWIVAGPGSGKTEVLVIRTLKLMFVDNVNPKSIFITTFTEKAAKNLFSRIINYANVIYSRYPNLRRIKDIHDLYIGTLHSLCSKILIKYRYPNYENVRLLDEIEQRLFLYEHSELVTDDSSTYLPFWITFDYLLEGYDPITKIRGWRNRNRPPHRWKRTNIAIKLFNRIVEDMLKIDELRNAGQHWKLVYRAYRDYQNNLNQHRRCDFAHLQNKFLDFLNDESFGGLFINGDNTEQNPGISYVLVDEYQDTNPIQEAIYFKLTENTHNLCVVGDDDQALYRFRGGSIECFINFNDACRREWNINENVRFYPLIDNYRSHERIVDYLNSYITSFEVLNRPGARISNEKTLNSAKEFPSEYPSLCYIQERNIEETSRRFAGLIRGLLDNDVIEVPSQCVLLMKTTRENTHWAQHFVNALSEQNIRAYNPRSRSFLEQEEIRIALGAFISIIDPDGIGIRRTHGSGIQEIVNRWVDDYQTFILNNYRDFNQQNINYYVDMASNIVRNFNSEDNWLNVNIIEILYRILAHNPFTIWQNDAERSFRLGKLTRIFEGYSAIPYPDFPGSNRGRLRKDINNNLCIDISWLRHFYNSLIGLLRIYGLNDPEVDDIIVPIDRLPIMTIHQSKGLQFDFVFVYKLLMRPEQDSDIQLEEDLSQFRLNRRENNFSVIEKSAQDLIRLFFVSYSRAKYVLIHLIPRSHFNSEGMGFIENNTRLFRELVSRL